MWFKKRWNVKITTLWSEIGKHSEKRNVGYINEFFQGWFSLGLSSWLAG